jgi:autotransporter-associated beta strand protein
MAQSITPAGGGTVSTSSGNISGGGAGEGVLVQQTGAGGVTVAGVNIDNTTATPTSSGLQVDGNGGVGAGLGITGSSTITSSNGNGVVLNGGTGENIGFSVSAGQTLTVSGNNGVVLAGDQSLFLADPASAGNIIGDASVSGSGTGIQNTTGAGAAGSLGNVTHNGIGTGINASGGSQDITIEGGSITAAGTGISLTSAGSSNLTSQAAIIAPTGIQVNPATGASITTSGAGTIDAVTSGQGTGIQVNTTGSGLLSINVGAAIGDNTAFSNGVVVSTASPSTAYANIRTTADIIASTNDTSNYGIYVQMNDSANRSTIDIGANVTGGNGIYTLGGVYDFVVREGATVTAGAVDGAGITSGNRNSSLNNAGTIQATNVGGDALEMYGVGSITNQSTGSILGADNGIDLLNSTVINNAGTIAGGTGGGIYGAGSNVTNSGTISGNYGIYGTRNPFTLVNSGTVSGDTNAINETVDSNRVNITNTGTINTTGGSGSSSAITLNSTSSVSSSTIVNSGVIAGGVSGYGISNDTVGTFSFANQNGGTISGAQGALLLSGTAAQTVNLDFGSTTNGDIVANDSGAVTLNIAGNFNGDYLGGSSSGVANLTLASTGAMQSAALGTAADSFTFLGGTINGTLDGGAGYDTFTSDLGAGSAATLNMSDLTSFEYFYHQSGTLTLTGTGNPMTGWNVTSGASVTLAGTINSPNTFAISSNGNTSGTDIEILSGSSITGWDGVFFNGVPSATFNNAGIVSVTGGPAVITNGATDMTNSGTLASSGSAAVYTGFGAATLTNSGMVSGSSTSFGIDALTGLNVDNQAGGTIYGGTGGIRSQGYYPSLLSVANEEGGSITGDVGITTTGSASLSLTNAGYVVGNTQGINAGGSGAVSIVNDASGVIGTGSVTGSTYTFGGTGDAIGLTAGMIVNKGNIDGANTGITALDNLTLTNSGTIYGLNGGAVVVNGTANIINAGGIYSDGPSAVTINSGTITNAASGTLGSGSNTSVVINGGGVFNNYGLASNVTATGASTINLMSGSTTGNIQLGAGDDTLAIFNGRGSSSSQIVDSGSGIVLANSGVLGAANYGTVDMGAGINTLLLRGTGDGTAANGDSGTFSLATSTGASILTKADSGTWTLTGSAVTPDLTINAGTGGTPGSGGLLVFDGTGNLTGTINVNGATIRAATAGAFGTATINMIDPTIQFGATGTYANDISLQSANPAGDPTILETFGSGITATLSGAITETTAGRPLVFASTDTNGNPNSGTFELTNAANSWSGTTTIDNGVTLRGTSDSVSGGSIDDNGVLAYNQPNSGTVGQDISGTGRVTVSGLDTNTLTFSGNNNQAGGFSVLDSSGVAFSGANVTNGVTVNLAGAARLYVVSGGSLVSNANNAVVANVPGSLITNEGSIQSGSFAAVYSSPTASNTTVINGGTISGPNSGTPYVMPALGLNGGSSSVTNLAGGLITGQRGAYLVGGDNSIDNAGTITGTGGNAITLGGGGIINNLAGGVLNATGTSNSWGILGNASAGNTVTISNAGTINASGGIVTQSVDGPAVVFNSGSINSSGAGIWANSGTLDLDNSGSILTTAGIGVQSTAGGTIINSGTINATGAGDFAIAVGAASNITNQAGGTIGGNGGSIALTGSDLINVTLDQQSVANGNIFSAGDGARNVGVAGVLNGNYDAQSGTGADTLILAATGSIGAIDLGGGDDKLTLRGDAVTGTVAGGSGSDLLSFDIAGSATFDAGIFSGFEARSMDGAGTLTLTGSDTMTSDFHVNSGTLVLSGGAALNGQAALITAAGTTTRLDGGNQQVRAISGSGAIDLGDNALLVSGPDSTSYSGTISGAGSLALFGGVLNLSGSNSYTGMTQISGGTLQLGADNVISDASTVLVGSGATFDLASFNDSVGGLAGDGTIDLGAGRLTVDQTQDNLFGGTISGAGGLTVNGGHTLALTGVNTYTGDTIVNGASLVIDGSVVSAISLNNGASLSGNGSTGAISVGSGAMLAPGIAGLGHLDANGDINFAAGSIYQVSVTPAASDSVTASGNITISGGTVQVLADGTAYSPLTRYAILGSGGALSGTFDGVSSNLAFLDPSLEYRANEVDLVLRRNDIRFADAALNGNQRSIANALQGQGAGGLYDLILVQSADGARTAFDALSGEVYASSATALLANRNRLQDAMSSNQLRQDGLSLWTDAGRSWGSFDSTDRGNASASVTSDELLDGLNLRKGAFAATVAGGRVRNTLDIGSRSSRAKSTSWVLGGQLSYGAASGLQAVAGGNYEWHKVRTTRSISFPGFADMTTSTRDARGYHLFGELGYAAAVGAVTVTPFVGVQHDHLTLDKVAETGGLSALDVRGRSLDLTATDVGVKVSSTADLGWAKFTPRAILGWQHVSGDRVGEMSAGFVAGGPDFTIAGAALPKDGARVGVDLDFDLKGARIVASYAGVLGGNSAEQTAKVGVQIRF